MESTGTRRIGPYFWSPLGGWSRGLFLMAMAALLTFTQAMAESDEAFFADLVRERYVEPFRAGDVEAWSMAFAEDAIALHNRRPPDRGREAIRAFGSLVHQVFDLAEYDVEVTDVRISEGWVYTVGRFSSRFVSKLDGSEPFGREEGKFVLVWERSEAGGWQIVLDMGNSNT